MTETISPVPEQIDTQQLAQDLVARARAEGVDLVQHEARNAGARALIGRVGSCAGSFGASSAGAWCSAAPVRRPADCACRRRMVHGQRIESPLLPRSHHSPASSADRAPTQIAVLHRAR